MEGEGKRARKQVAEPPAAVEGGGQTSEYKNANRVGMEYETVKKRIEKIKSMLQPLRAGAPLSSEVAAQAVTNLKDILGVKSLPSIGDDGTSIEHLQEKHAEEIKELKEEHEKALKELTEEKNAELEEMQRRHAEQLQAAKDEATLAALRLTAMQERLDAAAQERDDALARGYEMGLAKAKKK